MKNIQLFTIKKPTYKDIITLINENFKEVQGNESGIYIGKSPKSVTIDLETVQQLDETCLWEYQEGFEKRIPFNTPYITDIDFHFSNISKKVVSLLSKVYPEMLIYDDEGWLGTAEDYQNNTYEY